MKIALFGYGKMGKAIEKIALKRGHEVVLKISSEEMYYDLSIADLAIDFSNPNIAFQNVYSCIEKNIPVVSGTTGWLLKYDEVVKYCWKENGAFLYASNFSIGVNLFFNLNEYLAKMMNNIKGYDVEIKEIHHIHKLDKPSGTAIILAEQITENSEKEQWNIEKNSDKNLLIHVERKGEIPGTHSIKYESKVDKIEIKHTAFNRDGFALGAVIAAEWLVGKKGVFSMKDVLDL